MPCRVFILFLLSLLLLKYFRRLCSCLRKQLEIQCKETSLRRQSHPTCLQKLSTPSEKNYLWKKVNGQGRSVSLWQKLQGRDLWVKGVIFKQNGGGGKSSGRSRISQMDKGVHWKLWWTLPILFRNLMKMKIIGSKWRGRMEGLRLSVSANEIWQLVRVYERGRRHIHPTEKLKPEHFLPSWNLKCCAATLIAQTVKQCINTHKH